MAQYVNETMYGHAAIRERGFGCVALGERGYGRVAYENEVMGVSLF